MIEIRKLNRSYRRGDTRLAVLSDINLTVPEGEFTSITGPSGSGKSTLLSLIAGLDRPDSGSIRIDGMEITGLAEEPLSRLRGQKIGIIFQNYHLIPTLTTLENVRVPAEIRGDFEAAARGELLLQRVGLLERAQHYPSQLSGGEMQRAAIARSMICNPAILLADEPTGNLDSVNGQKIMELLLELNTRCTLLLVTHNPSLAALAGREIRLYDGRIEKIVNRRRRRGSGSPGKKKRSQGKEQKGQRK